MARRPFKGALCACSVPGEDGMMSSIARRGCIRRIGHLGPHRNALLEWERDADEYRPRRKEVRKVHRGSQMLTHEGYVAETNAQDRVDDRERRETRCLPHPGSDRLMGATLALPPCECSVTGRGTLKFPVRIKFCKEHGGR